MSGRLRRTSTRDHGDDPSPQGGVGGRGSGTTRPVCYDFYERKFDDDDRHRDPKKLPLRFKPLSLLPSPRSSSSTDLPLGGFADFSSLSSYYRVDLDDSPPLYDTPPKMGADRTTDASLSGPDPADLLFHPWVAEVPTHEPYNRPTPRDTETVSATNILPVLKKPPQERYWKDIAIALRQHTRRPHSFIVKEGVSGASPTTRLNG